MKFAGRTLGPFHALVATVLALVLWQGAVWGAEWLGWYGLSATLSEWGTVACFFVGLFWAVWGVEKLTQRFDRVASEAEQSGSVSDGLSVPAPVTHLPDSSPSSPAPPATRGRVWNPFDLRAWYYGRQSQRYKQSLSVLTSYTLMFFLLMVLFSRVTGCEERTYELPAGGGQEMIRQEVRVNRVIKKKFVINPYSSILFNPPKIDHIDPQIVQTTQHLYKVGQGQGDGAGFSGGTTSGKVRFIRLKYEGGDWDQDFGIDGDLNLLNQYGIRTQQKVENKTEYVTAAQLGTFKELKYPPLIYVTGMKGINLTANERKILKRYLLEHHGMIFGDNGGSRHFHNQFVALMRELTGVQEVAVPLDDIIHRRPYEVPFLPYVSPHGGKVALGWKVDGRWAAYYHPGDIGDAWAKDHAGVKPEIVEYCYQLGVNVIYYAHAEYNKWLMSQKQP